MSIMFLLGTAGLMQAVSSFPYILLLKSNNFNSPKCKLTDLAQSKAVSLCAVMGVVLNIAAAPSQ